MSAAAQSSLAGARSVAQRLDVSRDPEDNAADLIDVSNGVENALRSLLGGSPLAGQQLVREVRQREMITLTQAHALLDFLAVRDRLNDSGYKPTATDVSVARTAVSQLDQGFATGAPPVPQPAPVRPAPSAVTLEPFMAADARARWTRIPIWGWLMIAAAALLLAVGGGYYALRDGGGGSVASATKLLREGRREAARAEFERLSRENPRMAAPHLFLARMARDEGDYVSAQTHAEAAIRAEPANGVALREMGTILLLNGNLQSARTFFVRAITANGTDRTAMGLLACTLARMGRAQEAQTWLTRAGPGEWSSCVSAASPAQN